MIRIWLSRSTSVPMREQLSAQLILGILSRRIAPGERLPSVRELARRLSLHANTVSATYQDLAKRGWVSRRPGAGVFVRARKLPEGDGGVDAFVRTCIEDGAAHGYSSAALRDAFARVTQQTATTKFIVVDPDLELARIMAAEMGEAVGYTLPFSSFQDFKSGGDGTCVLLNEAHKNRFHELADAGQFRAISLRSMQDVLTGQLRPASPVLIGIASRSESILKWAATLLSALGFPAHSVLQRNPANAGWQDGLSVCDIVASDVIASAELHAHGIAATVFRVVSEDFLTEMRNLS